MNSAQRQNVISINKIIRRIDYELMKYHSEELDDSASLVIKYLKRGFLRSKDIIVGRDGVRESITSLLISIRPENIREEEDND